MMDTMEENFEYSREHQDLEIPFRLSTDVEISRTDFQFEGLKEINFGEIKPKKEVEKAKVEIRDRKGGLF